MEFKILEHKDFGEVRTSIDENGKILFCGVDVANALGYRDATNALIRLCLKDGVAFCHLTDNLGRVQETKFITEGNGYCIATIWIKALLILKHYPLWKRTLLWKHSGHKEEDFKMELVLAEKSSVAMNISKVLGATNKKDGYYEGNGYVVSWCVGHLVGLATAENYNESFAKWKYEDLPILPTDWKYSIAKGKEKQVKIIQSLMNNKDFATINCATDAGSEGELIFRLVYEKAGCIKPVKRLWISSMEEEAITKGFDELSGGKDFENLYQAALCRAKADWIVGINATRLFSVLYGQTLNIGRVMSPTLAMIVERNATISAFKPEPLYNVALAYNGFSLIGGKLKDKTQATAISQAWDGKDVVIESVERKEKLEKPPKLYDLTTLQREANKLLGFTAEQTLSYVQSLYEKKLCTYPRTDSRYLTQDMKNAVLAVVTASASFFMSESNSLPINVSQVTDNNKVSDHHAVIPTVKVKGLNL